MRVKLSKIDEINKILRTEIVELSELNSKRVVNGYSIHGQDLVMQINQYCNKSYEPDDVFIVFELRPENNFITEKDYNNNLTINSSYIFHVYIYGNYSTTLANILIARLLTDESRLNLQNQGINLKSITNLDNGTDFINDTLYPRTDFDINISSELQVEQKRQYNIHTLDTAGVQINVINSEENING